jgi:hypothetical protein
MEMQELNDLATSGACVRNPNRQPAFGFYRTADGCFRSDPH